MIKSNSPSLPLACCNAVFQPVEPVRFPLVTRFYQAQGYKVKLGRQERVFTITEAQQIIAAARLLPVGEDEIYWLRNLVVAQAWRAQGIGSRFMQQLLEHIAPADCFCFISPELERFYIDLGFQQLHDHQAPAAVSELAQRYALRSRGGYLLGRLASC